MQAIEAVFPLLSEKTGHEETLLALQSACKLAAGRPGNEQVLPQLGEGWIAEEALAIAVYCALSTSDFRSDVALAVNHGGDSDSTGFITGQLIGAIVGAQAIPNQWVRPLELREVIEEMSDDLACFTQWFQEDDPLSNDVAFYSAKYPGS